MPTTNPVPSQDPSDLLFNAGKLDEFVSGSNATYTDRLGVSRRTMVGIDAAADVVLSGLGYAPPVAYASGIALTLTTQTVEYAGEVYAPKVANLPFTTSGTFETAKFRLIQGVASADLASGGGAAMVGYTPAGTGAVATTVQSKLRETVSVKDFGAVGDGVADDTAAIQAALDANKSTQGFQPTRSRGIFFQEGTYLISTSLQVSSGQQLVGEGRKSLLKQAGGLTGQIVNLIGIEPDNACNEVIIQNLGFESSGSVWAIKATAGVVAQGLFNNLIFNCGYCLSLATYTQSCVVDTLLSVGPLNQLLHFKGNRNYITHLDKEGSTGSSADPYILIEAHTDSKSAGNVIDDVLIEQATSANKVPVKISGADKLEFLNYWIEPTSTNGYGIHIADSTFVHVGGYYQVPYSTNNKVKIENTTSVVFDYFDGSGEDVSLWNLLDIDAVSSLTIKSTRLRRGNDALRVAYPNVIIEQVINETANDSAAHRNPVHHLITGANMLVNPSFTAGSYRWTDGGYGTGTVTTVASELNSGLMLNIDYGSNIISLLAQNVTISANQVGKPFTFSAMVNAKTGSGWISVITSGCGTDDGNGNERVSAGTGWQLLTRTIIPQFAGTLLVGMWFINMQVVQLDECAFRFGQWNIPALDSFGSIDIDGKPVMFLTAAPTSGTWTQGARVFNSAPSVGQPKGWICTVAGTPGTWVSEGNL